MEDAESCQICSRLFTTQMVGTLDNCNHQFCLECIMHHSKHQNLCPLDRSTFRNVKATHKGETVAQFEVKEPKKKRNVPARYDFTTVCDTCQNAKCRDVLILCDACNLGYHLKCLYPPLKKVPKGEWYCSTCAPIILKGDKRRTRTRADMKTKEEMRSETNRCTVAADVETETASSSSSSTSNLDCATVSEDDSSSNACKQGPLVLAEGCTGMSKDLEHPSVLGSGIDEHPTSLEQSMEVEPPVRSPQKVCSNSIKVETPALSPQKVCSSSIKVETPVPSPPRVRSRSRSPLFGKPMNLEFLKKNISLSKRGELMFGSIHSSENPRNEFISDKDVSSGDSDDERCCYHDRQELSRKICDGKPLSITPKLPVFNLKVQNIRIQDNGKIVFVE